MSTVSAVPARGGNGHYVTKPITAPQRKLLALGLAGFVLLLLVASVAVGVPEHRFLAGLGVWFAGGVLAIIVGIVVSLWALKTGRFFADEPPDPVD